MKKINNALVNENTAATATVTTPIVEAVTTPTAKPKQYIVGTSEKAKQFIDDLCNELQVKGKTGKLIAMPSHAAVDMLLDIATNHRFYQIEVNGELESMDRFEEYRAKFESERAQESPDKLLAEYARIQARLKAIGAIA